MPRPATPRQCGAPASSTPSSVLSVPASLSFFVSLRLRYSSCLFHLSLRKVHHSDLRLSSTGSSGESSPASQALLGGSDFSRSPLHFVAFDQRFHLRLSFALDFRGRHAVEPGLLIVRCPSPSAFLEWRSRDLPGSCAILDDMPRSSTPADPQNRHFDPVGSAFRADRNVGSATNIFRGPIPRPTISLCTLRRQGRPCTTQHSVLAGG